MSHPEPMKADELRALDVRVRCELFGVRPRLVRVKGSTEQVEISNDSAYYCDGACTKWELERANEPQEYSYEIERAWVVVNELIRRGFRFELRKTVTGWWATFGEDMSADAETVEVAICLAALKTIEQKAGAV